MMIALYSKSSLSSKKPVCCKKMKKKKYKITFFTVPFLMSLLVLPCAAVALITIYLEKSELLFFRVINWFIKVVAFFFLLYIIIRCWYILFKILSSRCYFCNKQLENRTKEAIRYWLFPSWKVRKFWFLCRNCKLKTRATQ